jgi:hypothetical protein
MARAAQNRLTPERLEELKLFWLRKVDTEIAELRHLVDGWAALEALFAGGRFDGVDVERILALLKDALAEEAESARHLQDQLTATLATLTGLSEALETHPASLHQPRSTV